VDHDAYCRALPSWSLIWSARDQLAARLHDAQAVLVALFWVYSRSLLNRDVEERSHALTRHGLCRVLDGLHPKLRWTGRGLSLGDPNGRIVEIGERGFLLVPRAHLWPHVAAIVEEPWLPTPTSSAHPYQRIGTLNNQVKFLEVFC
jgi:hypothetical protein